MKFRITLTDEESVMVGSYVINVIEKLTDPSSFLEEIEDGCLIGEEEFESPVVMGIHAQHLGELIIRDARAIYFQREWEKKEKEPTEQEKCKICNTGSYEFSKFGFKIKESWRKIGGGSNW